jgi:transposase
MTDPQPRVTGGVDTHKDAHVAAALDELGRVLGTEAFPTTQAGYRALLRWLATFGEITAVGVEGTGAWGAGLARFLTAASVVVIEVTRPNRQHRRRHAKSDPADAIGAARAVLSGEADGTPKSAAGDVEAIRLLQVARRSAIKVRTPAANQLHAVLVTAPDELRAAFRGSSTPKIVARAARLRPGRIDSPTAAAKLTLVTQARRWLAVTDELATLDQHLDQLIASCAPSLIELNGVGTQTASALLIAAGDNPERSTQNAPSPRSAGRHHETLLRADNNDTDSTAAATATPTPRSTSSPSADSAGTPQPGPT